MSDMPYVCWGDVNVALAVGYYVFEGLRGDWGVGEKDGYPCRYQNFKFFMVPVHGTNTVLSLKRTIVICGIHIAYLVPCLIKVM